MDHTFANETYATERYLLGEMQPEERDEFEGHFFTCKACGEDVQTGSVFVENAKMVFRDQTLKAAPTARRTWFPARWAKGLRLQVAVPAFAAVALAGVVLYQDKVVIANLKAPQSMASPMILDGETRGALPKRETGKPLRFQMVLPRSPEGEQVLVEVVNAAGKTVRDGLVAVPDANEPLDVFFPGQLDPGRYSLVLRSQQGENAGEQMARNQFEIVEALRIPTEIAVPPPRNLEPGRRGRK